MRLFAIACYFLFINAMQLLGQKAPPVAFDPRPVEIPELHATAPRLITSMDLLALRDLHGLRISPNGKYIAFVVGQAQHDANSYRSGLFVVETKEGGTFRCLGTAGPPNWDRINQWIDDPPIWSPDGQYIYHRMGGFGAWQIWRWRVSGGGPVQVTHVPGDVTSFDLSADGHQLVLTVSVSTFTAEEIQKLKDNGILFDGTVRSFESRPFLAELEEARQRAPETWVHSIEDGTEHRATEDELSTLSPWDSDLPEKQYQTWGSLAGHHILSSKVSPDQKTVAFIQYIDDPREKYDRFLLFTKPVRGGKPIPLTPERGNAIEPYWWSADSKKIFYEVSEGNGRSRKLLIADVNGGEKQTIVSARDGEWLDDFSVDAAGRLVACSRENNSTPPQVAVVDVATGETRTLVDVNPEFRNLRLGQTSRLEVQSKYGDTFDTNVVLPPDYVKGKRYPLVITTYSSGDFFLRGAVGDEYPIHVFAANGFVVLDFNAVRDRNFKPGDFKTAMLQWESPIDGMKTAVEKLSRMGVVDQSKVAVTGLSHGSEFVHYAISHTDFPSVAIASHAASREPFSYYLEGEDLRNDSFRNWGLSGWLRGSSGDRWRRLSATLNADRIRAPILLNLSDSEYLVGLDEFVVMKELDKPIEMFIYVNELHEKNQPKHRYEIYERNLDWLKFWLKGEEDSSASKVAQYERWHKLRQMSRSVGVEPN